MAKKEPEHGVSGRPQRSTPSILRNLRNLRVLVLHPKDADAQELTQQLQRIGCQSVVMWPPPSTLPEAADVVFYAVHPGHAADRCEWMNANAAVPIIAVLNYENPTIVDVALSIGARSVLTSPLRATGILSSLAIAQQVHSELHDARRRIARLEQKLQSTHLISDAKLIVMHKQNVSDVEAYRLIRQQAMSKRMSVEEIARIIVDAHNIFSC